MDHKFVSSQKRKEKTRKEKTRKEKKRKEKKRKKNHFGYSFEILEILWKERSMCTAGIKQNASENCIFLGDLSHSLITGEIHWNKNLMEVMTHLPWEVSFQKILVLQTRETLYSDPKCETLGLWDD